MVKFHANILEKNGEKEFVVIPYEEFVKIQEELENYECLKALREAKSKEADANTTSFDQVKKGSTMAKDERQKYERVKSIGLRVGVKDASISLQQVKHEKFKDALKTHWQLDHGNVTPESICWLFCWAATGINSTATADHCKSIFDEILDKDYNWFKSNIGHEFARKFRYPNKTRKIEL